MEWNGVEWWIIMDIMDIMDYNGGIMNIMEEYNKYIINI